MTKNSPSPMSNQLKSPNSAKKKQNKNGNNALKQQSINQNTPSPKSKKTKSKSLTPEPQKKVSVLTPKLSKKQNTPKSEPQPKHKKLKEEIDEKISDEEFEAVLKGVGEKEKLKRVGKLDLSQSEEVVEDEEDDEDEDDDDDMDDDDDEEEEEEDGEDDDDDEDDDEDEDDDDDEDDDEDDDDDEEGEDEENDGTEKIEAKKEVNGTKKTKKEDKLKSKVSNKQTNQDAPKPVSNLEDEKRRAERDLRSLFVKGLALDVSEDDLRSLSKDVVEVRMHIRYHHNKKSKQKDGNTAKKIQNKYAFIEFSSESIAEKNKVDLQGKKLCDKEIFVDYVGSKSAHNAKKAPTRNDIDPCKLYITGFPTTITEDGLKSLFPKSVNITMPCRSKTKQPLGYAFIFFGNNKDAQDAHDRLHDTQHEGHQLVVLFARQTHHKANKSKRKLQNKKDFLPTKKAKVVKEEEEDAMSEDGESSDDDGEDSDA